MTDPRMTRNENRCADIAAELDTMEADIKQRDPDRKDWEARLQHEIALYCFHVLLRAEPAADAPAAEKSKREDDIDKALERIRDENMGRVSTIAGEARTARPVRR